VCAAEVKKKFQDCGTKKRCIPKNYFVDELRDKRSPSHTVKMRPLCCGTGVSPAFFRQVGIKKSPAGRRRHEKPARLLMWEQ
jgi:hypothetical protein